jgi:hypothetical protein
MGGHQLISGLMGEPITGSGAGERRLPGGPEAQRMRWPAAGPDQADILIVSAERRHWPDVAWACLSRRVRAR